MEADVGELFRNVSRWLETLSLTRPNYAFTSRIGRNWTRVILENRTSVTQFVYLGRPGNKEVGRNVPAFSRLSLCLCGFSSFYRLGHRRGPSHFELFYFQPGFILHKHFFTDSRVAVFSIRDAKPVNSLFDLCSGLCLPTESPSVPTVIRNLLRGEQANFTFSVPLSRLPASSLFSFDSCRCHGVPPIIEEKTPVVTHFGHYFGPIHFVTL